MSEEEQLVRTFIAKAKQARMLELLSNPRRRSKATNSLHHFRDLDSRWVVAVEPAEHCPARLRELLVSRGAIDECYLVSANRDLDQRRMPLALALERVVGRGMGTLISCVPGKLGYFEGEGPSYRCILERRAI
jgi:hypothetical protein